MKTINVHVILISGKANSGKGEFARALEKSFKESSNENVIRCSLSTYIRGITKNDFYWDGVDTPESREFMGEVYRLGTNIYKYHMSRRVWERDIVPNLSNDKTNIVIVESFREIQNYEYFKLLEKNEVVTSVSTIRIIRPNYSVAGFMETHVSEVDLDDFTFDYEIYNDRDIEYIGEMANKTCSDFFVKYVVKGGK